MTTLPLQVTTKKTKRIFSADTITLPAQPGIYAFLDAEKNVIYVGKSKNLKRRLSQYQNAKRIKQHHKMRTILAEASTLMYETCPDTLQAEILETRLIQRLRPKWNIASAFFFLYPFIGIEQSPGHIAITYTTQPEAFQFKGILHGCYRSRARTREAYFSLHALLSYFGHPEKNTLQLPKYSYHHALRKRAECWPEKFDTQFTQFLNGESKLFLETLAITLLENPDARRKSHEVQLHLKTLSRFYRQETQRLFRMRKKLSISNTFIPQLERDILFLQYKAAFKSTSH